MYKTKFKQHYLILLLTGLLCIWSVEAMAQAPEEPAPTETEVTNPPPFITRLIEITQLRLTQLRQEQMEQMRSEGAGWGNIMIATRLAERIAADSDSLLTFDKALAYVLIARTEGKGFGEIANENPFIEQLVDITKLTPEQVEQMRTNGAGWGNIMIATRLAERIAADSADSKDELTFTEALTSVLDARAEKKGFGLIAHENDLKLGRIVGNGNKVSAAFSYGPGEAGDTPNLNQNQERIRIKNQEKKQNIFGRFINMLGFGRKERPEKPSKPGKIEKPQRPEKPDRPEKLEKPERPERPEKPEKPEKPERPARPEKPEKPEKPERGPRR